MKQEVKKLLIRGLPYLLFVYLFDKIGAAIRSEEHTSELQSH